MTTLRRYSELGPDSMDRQVTRVAVITASGAFEGDFSYHRGDRISDAIRTSEGCSPTSASSSRSTSR